MGLPPATLAFSSVLIMSRKISLVRLQGLIRDFGGCWHRLWAFPGGPVEENPPPVQWT